MRELNETEKFPVVICEYERKLEVRITDPKVTNLKGAEDFLWKNMSRDFMQRNIKVIKCLRDRVESLKKEVSDVKQSAHIVTEKDSSLEGASRGGKMVNAAMKNKRK